MKTLAALILALACGCAPAEPGDTCQTERCEVATSFAPDPELVLYTQAALTRIARATGRTDLVIHEDGLPVELDGPLMAHTEDGTEVPACGVTPASKTGSGPWIAQRVAIDPEPLPGCPDLQVTVLHEIMHALAPEARHAETGIFSVHGGGRLNDDSLTALCSEFACQAFQPE